MQVLANEPLGDGTYGHPGDVGQRSDPGVIELLSEQPHGILEAARKGGPMTRPGDGFGPDRAALRAAEPADRPLDDQGIVLEPYCLHPEAWQLQQLVE